MAILWWLPPQQRQKWGDTHILSSGVWGSIFFDLFYVGGAYNLGSLIKSSHGKQAILYFCGLGFPIMMMWFDKMYYDARFTTRHHRHHADMVHRLAEIVQLCCVATALSRIQSVDIMSDPCRQADMFQFAFAMSLNAFLNLFKYAEVALYGVGDPAPKVASQRDIRWRILPCLSLLGAAVESGYSYYTYNFGQQVGAQGDDYNGDDDANVIDCQASKRPIWYCLSSWIAWAICGYFEQVIFAPKEQISEISMPMNVHFCMHRYGEWFMLMFGESIISLLIVDGNNKSFNQSIAFYSGVLSVIFLAHLHFRNEPHLERHALFRARHSNYLYTILVPVYSSALIAMGVSYKLFLYDFQELAEMKNSNNDKNHRSLGNGGGSDGDDYNSRQEYIERKEQFAADLFSGSIVTALVCIDLMLLLHEGIDAIQRKMLKLPKSKIALLLILKYALLVFLASFSSFYNDLQVMAAFGLVAILTQDFLRTSFKHNRKKRHHTQSNKDPITDEKEESFKNDEQSTSSATYDPDLNYSVSSEFQRKLNYELAKFEQNLAATPLVIEGATLTGRKGEINQARDPHSDEGMGYSSLIDM